MTSFAGQGTAAATIALLLLMGGAPAPDPHAPRILAPFVATPQEVVEAMLDLAGVTPGDVVYDLGSGDGRIVITAARRYGARGVGIEIDEALVHRSRVEARRARVADRVEFRHGDLMRADLSGASVVTLYLLSFSNLALRPKLEAELRPGTRIVSHRFDLGDWRPVATRHVETEGGTRHAIYLWRVPERRPR